MVKVISVDNLRVVSDINAEAFEKGFEGFSDYLKNAAYKGLYEVSFPVNPDWARRYTARIYEELEMLGYDNVQLLESSIHISWKKESSTEGNKSADENVDIAFRHFKEYTENKSIKNIMDVLKKTARSRKGDDGGFDIIMNPEAIWGFIAHEVLHRTLECGGIYNVTEFSNIRIVVSWRYKKGDE